MASTEPNLERKQVGVQLGLAVSCCTTLFSRVCMYVHYTLLCFHLVVFIYFCLFVFLLLCCMLVCFVCLFIFHANTVPRRSS